MPRIMAFTVLIPLLLSTTAFAGKYNDTLTGDWYGTRTSLSDAGLDIEASYTFDIMSNIKGGIRQETDFLDNLDINATIDGETLYGLKGSTIFLYFLNNNGDSFDGDNIGSVQGVDNIEVGSPHTAKLYEAWIEQNVMDDTWSFLAGLYDLNSEFYVTESSGLLLSSTFGIGTEEAQSGGNGPSIFPTTSLALRVKWQPNDKSYVMGVVLDGVSGDPDNGHGTQVKLGDGDGELYTLEGSYEFDFGRLAIGGWYYTAETDDLAVTGKTHNNNGAYVMAEKKLFDDSTGFVRFGMADKDVNQTDYAWATGLYTEHVFEGREDSQFSIAVSGAHNSDAYTDTNPGSDSSEIGFEITYSDQLTPWLRIQPDIQYTINPGTDPLVDDSLVIGSRVEIIF